MELFELLLRISLSFVVLFILTRIAGRKEISQMTFFNFVSAIAIGSIAANLAVSQNLSIRNGIIALTGWIIYTIVMDVVSINSKKARKVLEGDPQIVIKKGEIMENILRRKRLDVDSLNAMLRKKSIFSLAEVDYAIFETDGTLSVLKKEGKQSLTKADMNIPPATKVFTPIPIEVVSDGVIIEKNLSKLNVDSEWLNVQLKQAGVESISDVFYAEVQPDGTLYIDRRQDLLN